MTILGIDEVGRGCLAGPLVVGAVALNNPIAGIKDSKLLSKLKRSQLSKVIYDQALYCGIGWVTSSEVDNLGLTRAMSLAINLAINDMDIKIDKIIIDGNYNYLTADPRVETLVNGDQLVECVSAASIIAKVTRDTWMEKIAAKKYPNYFFDKHVGYGTKLHMQCINEFGVCSLHRLSFKPIALLTVN